MLVKKSRRKIPKNAVEPLMETCEWLSREWKKQPSDIFEHFLDLMSKYVDYFFSQPWPKKYDHEEATTFTDEDIDFVFESEEEFANRYTTVCLKKNINLEHGFMGYFGMFWTQQAFHEQFYRPLYKPVLEAFESFAQGSNDAHSLVNKLKEQFSVKLIHDSLIDLLEHEYPDDSRLKLIKEMCELLHTDEGLPSCGETRCEWYYRHKYPS
jgi:hypothetical protein